MFLETRTPAPVDALAASGQNDGHRQAGLLTTDVQHLEAPAVSGSCLDNEGLSKLN